MPENQLRMYIEFSAPMGRRGGIEHVALLDERGDGGRGSVPPARLRVLERRPDSVYRVLRSRRVKQGILPNKQMGRALKGRQDPIRCSSAREWQDANGCRSRNRPDARSASGPPDTTRSITAQVANRAAQGRRQMPLVVTFPEPRRSRPAVSRARRPAQRADSLDGNFPVEANETRWSFTPHQPGTQATTICSRCRSWRTAPATRSGGAFEVDNFETVDKGPNPRTVTLPFHVIR